MSAAAISFSDSQAPVHATRGGGIIPALTGVRALAAYLVFLHHVPPSVQAVGPVLHGMLTEAHIGVTMFFVLSGFLITYRYDGKLSLTAPDVKRYFWNRFARIYPLYLALLIPTLILAKERRLGRWLVEVTLTKGFFDEYKFAGIAQAWSLTAEECFYAAAPLLLIALRTRYRALVLPGIYVLGAALLGFGSHWKYHEFFGNPRFLCGYTFFGRALEFLLGAWMAMNLHRLEVFKTIPYKTYMGLLGMAASLVIFDGLKQGGKYPLGVLSPAGVLLNNLIVPFCIGLFYLGLLQDQSMVKRVLSTRAAQLLGKASYAFYLIHVGFIANFLISKTLTGWSLFLTLNVISILLFKLLEEPVNHWLRSRGPGRKAESADDPVPQSLEPIPLRRAS